MRLPGAGLAAALCAAGCAGMQPAPAETESPVRRDARLAVTWIGHATALVQMDGRFVLTDPNWSQFIGGFRGRAVAPGVPLASLPRIDAVIVSHLHMDHLDLPTLSLLDRRAALVLPPDGLRYAGHRGFREEVELDRWQSFAFRGLRITAVPVKHWGGRYAVDAIWNQSYAGYVVEHGDLAVFFAGDTGYDPALFKEIGRRFPGLDLALVPIAPYGGMMTGIHTNPEEAFRVFDDVGARYLVPIHFGTFSLNPEPADWFSRLARARGAEGTRAKLLAQGEQAVLVAEANR
jgi:L-ascorbate metabolism protein UlaG (beta-lactamase superfamily)